ncbi:MAG: DnaJ domain-containing protein [Acidobacteriota bacterium]
MRGQLSERPFGEVLGDLYRTRANGILTVNREKQTKAIFIEDGNPVYAISNTAEDQLGNRLVRDGRLGSEQLSQFGSGLNAQELSQKLSESGLISNPDLDNYQQQLISDIILSIFDWPNGEYSFEKRERARLTTNIKLHQSAPNLILPKVRNIQNEAIIRAPFNNPNRTIKPFANTPQALNDAPLEPMEGYVLSRITEPLNIQTALSLTGLPEQQALRCLYTLYAAGFLELEGGTNQAAKSAPRASIPTVAKTSGPLASKTAQPAEEEFNEAKFTQEVNRMLAFFASADLYEVLGVTRRANEADIKKAYYQLAKKYHPDRIHKDGSPELKASLEKVFAKITEAYERLKNPEQRQRYDDQIRGKPERSSPLPSTVPRTSTPPPRTSTPTPSAPAATRPSAPTQPTSGPAARPVQPTPTAAPNPTIQPTPTVQPTPAVQSTPAASSPAVAQKPQTPMAASRATGTVTSGAKPAPTPEMGEMHYAHGKQAMDRQDYVRAAYLLREAVNINPNNTQYRSTLVQILIKNSKWHKEAEDHLVKLIEAEPFNGNFHAMLGLLYKEGGLQKKAVAKFKEALSVDGKNRLARRELIEMGELKADKKGSAEVAAGGLGERFRALPPTIQYAIIGGGLLLIIMLLYTQL